MARRSTKARVEGAEAVKAELSGAGGVPNPVPGDDGDALERIAASFQARFPEQWEALALCPLQHGLIAMAETLKGKG